MYEKLKSLMLDDRIFFSLIVFGVAIGSFGLGRASVVVKEVSTSRVEQSAVDVTPALNTEPLPKTDVATQSKTKTVRAQATSTEVPLSELSREGIVASKSGTKYHLLDCPGAKQIKEENKIYFATAQAAEAAGYKPAANCPALQ